MRKIFCQFYKSVIAVYAMFHEEFIEKVVYSMQHNRRSSNNLSITIIVNIKGHENTDIEVNTLYLFTMPSWARLPLLSTWLLRNQVQYLLLSRVIALLIYRVGTVFT